jgi:type II secretion system protein G
MLNTNRPSRDNAAGFTLIELLIVVAIIAILAAIAVPNFMEAQTRAKISRVVTDLRTISYGLDMYKLDNNKYPPSPWPSPGYYTHIGYPHPSNRKSHLFKELTTSIAYVNSLPRSPFHGLDWISNASGRYQGHARESEPGFVVRQWLHVSFHETLGGWRNKLYWLGDVGPNRQWDNTPRGNGSLQVPYDASNGTISMGNIYRFGP